MNIKHPFRSECSVCALRRVLQQRHMQAYRLYLVNRDNAAGYVRHCEASVTLCRKLSYIGNKANTIIMESIVASLTESMSSAFSAILAARFASGTTPRCGGSSICLRAIPDAGVFDRDAGHKNWRREVS